jgi:hypothetical protein
MIVSHSKKFIFVKPRKTAGTSVELLLSKLCGDEDVITPFGYDPQKDIRERHGARAPQNYRVALKPAIDYSLKDLARIVKHRRLPGQYFEEHESAQNIKNALGRSTWNTYRKITIVRNPWDHAVSFFNWRIFRGRSYDFRTYVESYYSSIWRTIATEQGDLEMDYIIRFEHLKEDIDRLIQELGGPKELELPRAKTKVRKQRDYREFYVPETIERVREKNQHLLRHFPYRYEGDQAMV